MTPREPLTRYEDALVKKAAEMDEAATSQHHEIRAVYLREGADLLRSTAANLTLRDQAREAEITRLTRENEFRKQMLAKERTTAAIFRKAWSEANQRCNELEAREAEIREKGEWLRVREAHNLKESLKLREGQAYESAAHVRGMSEAYGIAATFVESLLTPSQEGVK
jgi:hypothetical protein